MNSLGNIKISDNMYLGGLLTEPRVAIQRSRSIDGVNFVRATPQIGGRTLTLGTTQLNGATQGIWCEKVVKEIKELEVLANVVDLVYNGQTYKVVITGSGDMQQLRQQQRSSDTKAYIGTINLLEV